MYGVGKRRPSLFLFDMWEFWSSIYSIYILYKANLLSDLKTFSPIYTHFRDIFNDSFEVIIATEFCQRTTIPFYDDLTGFIETIRRKL